MAHHGLRLRADCHSSSDSEGESIAETQLTSATDGRNFALIERVMPSGARDELQVA